MCVCVVCMYIYIYIFGVKIAPLRTTSYEQKLITTTPKNLKALDVMVNVARFVRILRRHVSLKDRKKKKREKETLQSDKIKIPFSPTQYAFHNVY